VNFIELAHVLNKKTEEQMLLDWVPEKIAGEKPFMLER